MLSIQLFFIGFPHKYPHDEQNKQCDWNQCDPKKPIVIIQLQGPEDKKGTKNQKPYVQAIVTSFEVTVRIILDSILSQLDVDQPTGYGVD